MKTGHQRRGFFASPGLSRKLLAIVTGLTLALALVLVALLNWPLPEMPRPGITGEFLVRNVAIVDVVNGQTVPARDVVVRNGRIDSIGASLPGNGQGGLVVVDGTGKFLIPGLWDMHVHSLKISPQYTHPLSIANGITGVREMWACPALADSFVACGEDIERWRAGLRDHSHLAPRYIMRSSYAINGEQGVPAAAPAFFKARNADEAQALVAHQAAAGVDFLKTYTNVSAAAYDALAAQASKQGLLFAGHVPVRVPLEQVLAAGQHSVEHPRIFLFDCYRGAAGFRALPDPVAAYTINMRARFIDEHDPVRCAELMAAMAASDTWWTPTLQVLRMSALAGNREFREDPRRRYIPFIFWAGLWQADADRAVADARQAPGRDVHAELYRLAMDNVRQAHRAGVRIVAGTDSGDTYVFPGFAIHDELAELVRAGLTPADALRSATIDAARFSGKAQAFGSIESGKVADMVLLDANPLTDIRSTGKIAGLFFNGQYLDRAALDGLLVFAEEQAGGLRTNLQLLWGALRSPIVWAQAAD
ncbi:MAG: amidohydrolase family protein [Rubrivivax sp.]|nr:amidohydrolase family protein [Rubrivivax sp.]